MSAGRWHDLKPRMLSAAVMLLVGAVEIWLGGPPFLALVLLLVGLMIWELARLSAPAAQAMAPAVALLAGLSLLGAERGQVPLWVAGVLLVLPSLLLLFTARRDRLIVAGYALALMVGGHGLFILRHEAGKAAILWVVGIVIASDVAGYFAGRLIGGPKFWPRVSPKKTWSGTIAGWIAAALVGLAFVVARHGQPALVLISPLIAFAGQLGDIAESWIKRRAGVKDASRLIPGHGGVLDRFDALIGAMVAVMLLSLVMPLPVGG